MKLKLKLKSKLIVMTVTFIVIPMIICTVIVSMLFKSQFAKQAKEKINITYDTVFADLDNKKADYSKKAKIFIGDKDIVDKVKFLSAEKENLSTEDMYLRVKVGLISELAKFARFGSYNELKIFDKEGDLLVFYKYDGKSQSLGYLKDKKEGGRSLMWQEIKGEEAEHQWREMNIPKDFPERFDGRISDKFSVGYGTIGNTISLQALVPINVFDFATEKESLFGMLVVDTYLEQNYVNAVSEICKTEINLFTGEKLSAGTLTTYQKIPQEYMDEIRGIIGGGSKGRSDWVISKETSIGDDSYYQGFYPLVDDGNLAGVISVASSKNEAKTKTKNAIFYLMSILLICAGVGVPISFFFSSRISKPVRKMVYMIEDIAEGEGDLTMRIDKVGTNDEIADLAKGFNKFMDKLQGIIKQVADSANQVASSAEEFSATASQIATGAEQQGSQTQRVSTSAEDMSTNMNSVAVAMEEASTNIGMVAAAAEQMTSTISEIAQNSEKSRGITAEAVSQTEKTSEKVGELGRAADEISRVTEAITDISDQTNLLALNATIEAARAGDAGKGFAVVANEIKELAKQTAEATCEIKEKIEGIQGSTSATVTEIGQISKVISDVNEIVSTIATAVEEQSVTTKEIASNVNQASTGIQEVTEKAAHSSTVSNEIAKDIGNVNQAASEMSNNSSRVNENAAELSELAKELKEMMGKFKV
ncbi:MAG: methyl-accepting chemotaxis protein [Thermodesulfobacteriota bacterium]|nr:methyl-accepting chemotaxis protein [Thermodesulfobacteriota bacterium]